jgi:hypothetical protein
VFVAAPEGAKLVAIDVDGKTVMDAKQPAGAQDATRFPGGLVVVGDGAPPDGSAHGPYAALVDASGKAKWVTRFPTSPTASDVGVGVVLRVASREDAIAVTIAARGGTVSVGGSSFTNALALLNADGSVRATAPLDGGEGPTHLAIDTRGFVIGRSATTSFSIAAFDTDGAPRWRRPFDSATLSSVASCTDGVIVSATTDRPRLIRFDAGGGDQGAVDAPVAGSLAACDSRGVVVAGTIFGVLLDPRFRPIGSENKFGAYIATFGLDGGPGEIRSFGAEHTQPNAIVAASDKLILTGTSRGAQCDQVFVARERR